MADLFNYKCPACGGAMVFDAEQQKMKCPYCDTLVDMSQFQEQADELAASAESPAEPEDAVETEGDWNSSGSEWSEEEKAGLKVYGCDSCGGEIIADAQTGATTCPYCGSNVVMKGAFQGKLKPDKVIPFKISKKQAIEAYKTMTKGRWLLPSAFTSNSRIEKMQGVYIPFWIFNATAHVQLAYTGTRVHTHITGDTEHVTTEYFQVEREGDVSFRDVPADCSRKVDNVMMESIEPYDYSEAVRFQPAYLAGFLADRYDEDVEESRNRAEARIERSAEIPFRRTITEPYSTLTKDFSSVRIHDATYDYALLPVWLMNTSWEGKTYLYAINGQTGKTVGDFPEDKKAFWKYVLTRGGIVAAVMYGLSFLFSAL